MAHKIMVSIQKGGCGKTTTTAILAEILAASGYKILVLDLDSQGNATQMITQRNIYEFSENTILEAIKEEDPLKYVVEVKENLHLLPAEDMLVTFSRYIYTKGVKKPLEVLKHAMVDVENEYDFILMDCPPNLGDIVLNATVYADYYLIPVQCEAFGMDALDRFTQFMADAKAEGHTEVELLGIVFTMRDNRTVSEKVIADNIRRNYGEHVFHTEIRRKAKLKDFALMGTTMDKKSDIIALEEYMNLTEEVIKRVTKKEGSAAR